MILPLARNKMTPVVIMGELRRKEASNARGIYPTLTQINTKKKCMYQKHAMEEMVSCLETILRRGLSCQKTLISVSLLTVPLTTVT